jgi:ceramide glucosyltransferase
MRDMELFTVPPWVVIYWTVNGLLLFLCLSAVLFYSYAIYAAIRFFSQSRPLISAFHPPVTILKPVCGLDEGTYENLASFCQQEYPDYQLVFAVRDRHDPVLPIVNQLIQDFPAVDMQVVVNDRIIGTNLKVSNLANAVPVAKHAIWVLADSDIRVEATYLQHIVQPLSDPLVGVVTCPYRSQATGWVATLEALGTATDFHAGVLVAQTLNGVSFALGSTIVIRTAVLDAIGGFAAIANYLADDFMLGQLASRQGYRVILSNYLVEHRLPTESIAESWQRQTRWARCIRVSRPWGYLGLLFTDGTVSSLLLLFITGASSWAWVVLSLTWLMRLGMAWVVGAYGLQDTTARWFFWLAPLRDLLGFAVWCYGWWGNVIEWRGNRLLLTRDGKMLPLTQPSHDRQLNVTT